MMSPELASDAGWLAADSDFGPQRELVELLAQLVEEGYAKCVGHQVVMPWDRVYDLMSTESYEGSIPLLGLPPVVPLRPVLTSTHSLADPEFAITISGWLKSDGRPAATQFSLNGAVITQGNEQFLLERSSWELLEEIRTFYHRPPESRNYEGNMQGWSRIRAHALKSRANLANFLQHTIVVTPMMIEFSLRKADFEGHKTVEVIPGFSGSPPGWLNAFDRKTCVDDLYQIADGENLTHVIITPEVKSVLQEVKRFAGRRVSGDRAEAFIRNPFGVLGPEAASVVSQEQFEKAREDAGLYYSRFTTHVLLSSQQYPTEVSLKIEEPIRGEILNRTYVFSGREDLENFCHKLAACLAREAQVLFWQGYDLELLGDARDQLELLLNALRGMTLSSQISHADIYDLSQYSDRIEGIDVEKPYYSPYIARKSSGDPWLPETTDKVISFVPPGQTGPVSVVLDNEAQERFNHELEKAKAAGKSAFSFPGLPQDIPVAEAENILSAFANVNPDLQKGTFPKPDRGGSRPEPKKSLIIKPNIDALTHIEPGSIETFPKGTPPVLCSSLLPSTVLKEHQEIGIAWLQHHWAASPSKCRGAFLADDMGLGKTLQLLAFIGHCLEEDPGLDPVLIVAPVSLLENWVEEIGKFFQPGTFSLLTLYGDSLAAKRAPKHALDKDLLANGISRLLVKNWLGDARLVLTTYETLRDLEFSLAAQKWSIMVCDEAQKIKNPNAMVTRAAKKQNVRFKVACTGTPVENTLADLWCLFDYIQPGLLGALNDFGREYRKPIEAETEEEKKKVEELREIIAPQILRREKKDVAKDLPEKHIVADCKQIRMSPLQKQLYSQAVTKFRAESTAQEGGRKPRYHLGLLLHIRKICSDPRPMGQQWTDGELFSTAATNSPKLAWLINSLKCIKDKGEKAIVFTELRELQRALKRYIADQLQYNPEIVNGETSAVGNSTKSRQKVIRAFQQRPGFGVIILSPLAVGFGVNIQAANHVIHYTRMWNPSKEDQATDRAYRIGQTKQVFVYYPVIYDDAFMTFDAKLDSLLEWKRKLSSDMLNGTPEVGMCEFSDLQDVDGSSAFPVKPLSLDDVLHLQSGAFEIYCSLLWSKQGYATYRTRQSGDGGVDVVGIKGGEGILVQCKSTSIEGQHLDWDAIKEVVAGEAAYSQIHPGIQFKKVAVTNQYFNEYARSQAGYNAVDIVTKEELKEMVRRFPITNIDLEQAMIQDVCPP
jgi:Holliday junction resolvase